MRISRREFVKSVTASGIALSVSRLALAEEPEFAARQDLSVSAVRDGDHTAEPGVGDGHHRPTRIPYSRQA
jgi:hypothetical protein